MITKLYAIYDRVSKHHNPPFSQLNDGMALRSIRDRLIGDTHLQNNCNDYSLYEVGEYDDSNGDITNLDNRLVAHIKDVMEKTDAKRDDKSLQSGG